MVSVIQFIDMDFDFFEKLTKNEANAFLRRFLEEESSNIKEIAKQCAADGLKMDYSIKSISPFMRWVVSRLTTVPLAPDPTVPEWLRNNDVYAKNLFDFDEPSGILVMRAGYYLGESFVRSHSGLHWGIGDIETAEANMPVVTGFQYQLEMAPVLVADNLLARIISDPGKIGDIERAVESWNGDI
jgi:hypothetical protein